jgi:hypothetical protein
MLLYATICYYMLLYATICYYMLLYATPSLAFFIKLFKPANKVASSIEGYKLLKSVAF